MTAPESGTATSFGCCARARAEARSGRIARLAMRPEITIAPLSRNVSWNLLWNNDGAVLRRHRLSFGISHHKPHHIAAGGHVTGRPDCYAAGRNGVERLIFQAHLDGFLNAGNVVSVAVEHAAHQRQSC